ncbi:hypothetical protein JL720_2464 [Aureococcus anophagefferens]|nr:hypothetical protein JL720_2464 [Aureococcus anophagefferens]
MSALQMRSARDDLVSSKAVVSFESPRAGDGPPLALAPAPLPQFVGDARTFQTLFALPLAGGGATLAVHRAGSTLVALSRAARLEDGGFRDALRAEDAGVEEAKAEPPRLHGARAAFERAARRRRAALRAIVAAAADSQKSLGARRSEEAARAVEALADAALCPATGDEAARRPLASSPRPWPDYARVRRWRVGAADVLSGSDALVDRRFDADTAVRLIRGRWRAARGGGRAAGEEEAVEVAAGHALRASPTACAHLRLGADGGAGIWTRRRVAPRPAPGLATTALDLLAEIEDSEGEPHLAMRASSRR